MNLPARSRFAGFMSSPNNKAILWMVLGGFDFATMAALIHALGKECDWLILAFLRMFLSFVFSLILAVRAGLAPIVLDVPLLWLRSFIGCSAMVATFYALTRLPISDVAVITETKPIWVALLAGYLLGEAAGKRIWVSIIMGMTGVVLVEHAHIGNGSLAGLAALYGALAGAVVMIILRKLRGLDPRVIVTHFAGTASLTCLVLIFALGKDFNLSFMSETKNLLMLAGVGIFGTVGQLAMTKAFAMGEAPGVSAAGFVKVGFSAGYDLLVFRYAIELVTLLGITLILGSTAWLIKPARPRKAVEEVNKEEIRGVETG